MDILAPIASKQTIVDAYDQFLSAHPNVKLAIIGETKCLSDKNSTSDVFHNPVVSR